GPPVSRVSADLPRTRITNVSAPLRVLASVHCVCPSTQAQPVSSVSADQALPRSAMCPQSETSYVIESGIRHYAKAVGAGMRTSTTERFHLTGSIDKAHEFAELAADDPNLDQSRIKIRAIGERIIEIEHPGTSHRDQMSDSEQLGHFRGCRSLDDWVHALPLGGPERRVYFNADPDPVLRESAIATPFSRKMVSQRTKAGMIDYRFRVGATVIPQTAINCTGSAAEARFELARTFGTGVADAAARSCISAEQYLTDGCAVSLFLQAFSQTDALSDATNPACYLDVWVQHEKVHCVPKPIKTYESLLLERYTNSFSNRGLVLLVLQSLPVVRDEGGGGAGSCWRIEEYGGAFFGRLKAVKGSRRGVVGGWRSVEEHGGAWMSMEERGGDIFLALESSSRIAVKGSWVNHGGIVVESW
ncbi:hypothetical protein T492DRAFT_1129224, partial [Pavlovales sp. CCMP2436]